MLIEHPGKPCVVISSKQDAAGLDKAKKLNIETAIVNKKDFGADRGVFEEKLNEVLFAYNAEVICLAGFMHILSEKFVSLWNSKLLNIHPSLLPKFKGLNTHQRAIEAGDDKSGCTVHLVTASLDSGPILGQAVVPIQSDDTPEKLRKRVLKEELILYPIVLRRFLSGKTRSIFFK